MGFAPALGFQVVHALGAATGGDFSLPADMDHLEVHFGGSDSFVPSQETYLGKLVATGGMVLAGVPAVGSFTTQTADPGYVKVVAVDRSGNRSGASEAVAMTPRLLRDEHIDSLTASKITAGTILTNLLNAVRIMTAESGARVELTEEGFSAYNSAGQRTIAIATDGSMRAFNDDGEETVTIEPDGSVQVTGTVKTLVNGDGVSILPGALPKIRLTPADTYDHEALIRCWNSGLGTVVDFGIRRTDDPEQADGGNLLMWEGGTSLSHYSVATGIEQFIGIDYPNDGRFHFRGKWPAAFGQSDDALAGDLIILGAGFGATTVTYGPTMAGGICPMATVYGASPNFYWCLTTSNATGCGISWSDTNAHTIYIWIFRKG